MLTFILIKTIFFDSLQLFFKYLQNKPLLGAIIQEAYYRIHEEMDKLKGIIIEKDVNDYQETDVQIEGA